MSFIEQLPLKGGKKNEKPRDRPKGWRKNAGVSYANVQIDSMFKEQIDLERKKGERNADTIRRLFKEKADKIQTLTQENDRLKSILQLQK
jgi:hypothetical protein